MNYDPTHQLLCWCGHHLATHFDDGKGSCLGVGCNVQVKDCPFFRDRTLPDPLEKRIARPAHTPRCRCYTCKKYLEQNPHAYRG